jgi:signal transduction histidine kinase
MLNFLGNALPFLLALISAITFKVSSIIDGPSVNITDTGVGISASAIEQLFTKNINPTTLGTANEKGTGLGLLLCKEFIEQNKGTISVSSSEGNGSIFQITLPTEA